VFGEQGFDVALISRTKENLDPMVGDLTESGINAAAFVGDVSNSASLTSALEQAASQFVRQHRPTSLLQRFASVEEIANMVVYVSSKEASATNGAALRAEGGIIQTIA